MNDFNDLFILLCFIFVSCVFVAPSPRRRRPSTSSPLKKDNDKIEHESEPRPKTTTARRKIMASANRRSEMASVDQVPASSNNRFRVRYKPKTDTAVTAPGNNSSLDFAASTKDKKSKDGYKVK